MKTKDNIRFYNLGKEEYENSFNISAKHNLINKMNLFSIRGNTSRNLFIIIICKKSRSFINFEI